MIHKPRSNSIVNKGHLLSLCIALWGLLIFSTGWAANPPDRYQDFDLRQTDGSLLNYSCTRTRLYRVPSGTKFADAPGDVLHYKGIKAITFGGANVTWEFATGISGDCFQAGNTMSCTNTNVSIDLPPLGTSVAPDDEAILHPNGSDAGTLTLGESYFMLKVALAGNALIYCDQTYNFRIESSGGGWGDPHITTVDGVKYDFQSAGEFIALRGDGIEVQTRQTAVSKQNVSAPNAYTGIASCVSIYTAVALRVGPHRVTIQPNISGDPDPSGLQIRVDGVLTALGPEGIDLASCDCPSEEIQRSGRIQRAADEESIEILYTDGTRLVVTPAWWEGQQKWYLNVNIYDTTASEGIMGRIAEGGWLPALSNSSSVGPKATDIQERYVQLYETFADSWRVTDDNSLFDYAPGTSTATFTIDDWPRENASHCLLEGEPIAEPVDQAVAEEACSNVVDPDNRENCIFDVRETGHTGFADAYERSEQLIPGATRTTLTADKDESTPGTIVTFTAKVQRSVSTIGKVTAGRIQFVLDGSNVGDPVAFDNNGNATWSTSTLSVGNHEVEAHFLPSAFGEPFRASSGKLTHVVSRTGGNGEDGKNMWWLWFLILLLILIFLWFKKHFMSSKVSSRP